MENFFADFPRHGKIWTEFSTPWKIFCGFFHAMENYFPHRGKYPFPDLNEAAVPLAKAELLPVRHPQACHAMGVDVDFSIVSFLILHF